MTMIMTSIAERAVEGRVHRAAVRARARERNNGPAISWQLGKPMRISYCWEPIAGSVLS
jgi:hypothetical protein